MKRFWIILPAGLIAIALIASFFRIGALWGLGAWGAVVPLVALVVAIVVVPQMFVKSAPDPFRLIPRIRSRAARFAAVAAASTILLWLLRSRTELWGERFSLRAALETGAYRPGAPLGTFIQREIYRFMNGIFLSNADSIITFFSILAGAIYAVLAIRAAELLFGERETGDLERPAAAVLLSGGFVALFFGAGGTVQIAIVATLGFITESIRFLRGKCPLALPAVLLAVAILSHFSAVFLVPAFVYLLVRGARAPDSRKQSLVAGGLFVLCLAAAEIAFAMIAKKSGLEHTATFGMRFSFGRHALANALNALLIVGPASVAGVLLLAASVRKKAQDAAAGTAPGEFAFLKACALSALAGFIVGAELVDGGLGWHMFAVTGPALSIYALWGLTREFARAEYLKRAILALFLAGLFHTIPLVLVDMSPRPAEKRLFGLDLAPGRAQMIIADFALERGDLEKARTWYLASAEKDPSNALAKSRLGRIAMKREEYPEAITHYLGAHELRPNGARERFDLAEALIANRWYPEAIAQLETLTVAHPESVAFWRRLGFALNNGNRYEPAVAAYETALALEPRDGQNVRNLVSALLNRGAELQTANRLDDARALYERVIETYPRDWRAYNNLATIEMKLGRTEKAREILGGALASYPYETSLHFNMGIVFDKLGKYKEALHHMRLARDFDPIYSAAPIHIERLEKKLGIWYPSLPDTGTSPIENP
ncbi:MAG: tetratricopeptide repeat protein [Candidatus Krumholzibacteriia bacterium]